MRESCRFELYLGAKQHENDVPVLDSNIGPAAVVRNMQYVLASTPAAWRLIVVDHCYTSVALFQQLLAVKMYVVGTIRTNSIGYNKAVVDPRKTRSRSGTRGKFKISWSLDAPSMLSLS